MSKMKEVAALLGVELGETFEVTGHNCVFRLEEDSMRVRDDCDIWHVYEGTALYGVLSGAKRIIKKPWKPALNEDYFMCSNGTVSKVQWFTDSIMCLENYAVGNCFKSREEAGAHSKEVLARLEKIYDEGKPLIGADEWRDKE